MEFMQEYHNIKPNYSSAQEHVPEAERNNRVIQERCRAAYHGLPFRNLPKLMLKTLVMESTRKLNFFPPKGGISSHYSPREIMHQEKLDYTKQCSIPMFSYVQAHDEPKPSNTQAARTIDCIYLRPLSNIQGGHELMNLATGKTITRRKVTVVPMTQAVIDTVERMASQQGMKGLKLRTKTGNILFDSAWIAGVDYQPQQQQHEYENNENIDYNNDNNDNEMENIIDIDEDKYDEIDPNEIADDFLLETNPTEVDDEEEHNKNNVGEDNEETEENQNNDEEENEEEEVEQPAPPRRSTRASVKPSDYDVKSFKGQSYIQTDEEMAVEYTLSDAKVIATII
jgi:hypothetical protein